VHVRGVLVSAIRWLVLAVGVGLTTASFGLLVDEHDRAVGATPWWWLGLVGVAVTVLALGSPWSARVRRDDDASRRGGW
jgi:hypothetical protein